MRYFFIFHVYLQLTEKFQPFTVVSVIAAGDLFQLPPAGGKPVYANYKNNWQNINPLWNVFKIFELTEVKRPR